MEFFIVKWLHILSSTIIMGTGIGSAFLMFAANRRKNVAEIYFAARHVVIADWIFTTPAVLFQLVSGLYLVHLAGYRHQAGFSCDVQNAYATLEAKRKIAAKVMGIKPYEYPGQYMTHKYSRQRVIKKQPNAPRLNEYSHRLCSGQSTEPLH